MKDLLDLLMIIAYIFPAYATNGAPVLFARLFTKLHPLDCGALFTDGRRILGDGKTLEGLLSGLVAGTLSGVIISSLLKGLYRSQVEFMLLSLGAIMGDVLGSFIKRRLGLMRGRPAPPLDQLGFLVFSLIITWTIMGPQSWANFSTVIFLLLLTFFLHIGTNMAAYLLGLKDRWY